MDNNEREHHTGENRRWGFLNTVFGAILEEFGGCLVTVITVIIIGLLVYWLRR